MPTLQAENLGDLVANTLNELHEMQFTEIATDLTDHVAWHQLYKKARVNITAGPQVQFNVLVDHNQSASNQGLFAVDNVNVRDGMITATVPWRHSTTNYAIERREIKMNRSPRQIINLLKERRIMAMIAMAELMEGNFWNFPSASDADTPYGYPYWIHKNATTGFNGGIPTGYSDVAGISPTTYPRWNNYTYQYTSVTKDDLIRAWRTACRKINFRPPVQGIPNFGYQDKKQFGWYTNNDTIGALEELLEQQNDNLGNSLNSKDGMTLFYRTPVEYVPKLDDDTTNPVIGIPWSVFKTYVLRGEWLYETRIPIEPGQHTVMSNHVDCSYQFVMRNRRVGMVLATGVTYPS